MPIEVKFQFESGDDIVKFLASLPLTSRHLVGVSEAKATAAARCVNGALSAIVTPEKQETARQSTGKVKGEPKTEPPATPETALTEALSYEKDLAPVFARAVAVDKASALAVLGGRDAFSVPQAEWPALIAAFQALVDGALSVIAVDYERDVVPKIKAAQGKDKAKLVEILTAHGGVDPATGKPSGKFVPAEKLAALVAALDVLGA